MFLEAGNSRDSNRVDEFMLGLDQAGDGSLEPSNNNSDGNSSASDGSREEKKRSDERVDECGHCVDLGLDGSSHSGSQVSDCDGDGGTDLLKSGDGAANSGSELDNLLRSKANDLASDSSNSPGGYTNYVDCRCVQGLGNCLVVGPEEGLDLNDDLGVYTALDSIEGIVCGKVSIQEVVYLQKVLTDLIDIHRDSIREGVD